MVILHPTVGSSGSPYIQHSCCSAFRQECIWNFTPSRNLILGIHRINQPHGVHRMAHAKLGRFSVRGSVDRFSPPHHARAPRFHCDLDGGRLFRPLMMLVPLERSAASIGNLVIHRAAAPIVSSSIPSNSSVLSDLSPLQ